MSHPLPPGVQRKLEHTLGQWPNWQCQPPLQQQPEVREVLSPGSSNFSVLVVAEQQHVVRIDGVNPASHGLSRHCEWRTLAEAHRAGLAPQPQYFNPELGSLVCAYLPPDSGAAPGIEELARLLRGIHALPPRHLRLDLAERVLRYEKQLEHAGKPLGNTLRASRDAVHTLLAADSALSPEPLVLCHNDLLAANRLYHQGRLLALDWEYSAMASPWYELAVIVNGDALDEATALALVRAYLQREPERAELAELQRYGCIYRYLELLWYLALERPVLDAEQIASRESALADILSRLKI